jgi:hypothetical protein
MKRRPELLGNSKLAASLRQLGIRFFDSRIGTSGEIRPSFIIRTIDSGQLPLDIREKLCLPLLDGIFCDLLAPRNQLLELFSFISCHVSSPFVAGGRPDGVNSQR